MWDSRACGVQVPDVKTAYTPQEIPAFVIRRQPGMSTTYTIRSGDTLGGIAKRFNTTVAKLQSANNISNPNVIYAGRTLTIPDSYSSTPAPQNNGGNSGVSQTYTVKSGDTLSGIASRYGTTVSALASLNGISNPNLIHVGQTLRIPGGGSSNPTNPTTPTGPVTPTNPGPTTGGISKAQLQAIMPNLSSAKADEYLPLLNAAMVQGGINTPRRQAAFLAQLAHESGQLRYFEEIASGAAYEGRRDLGNTQPGDGVRYKGRGPIQLTGRHNYRIAGQALGIDLENNPTLAARPDVGFKIAVWYWNSRNLSAQADAGNFDAITRAINGGYNGKADRDRYWATAKRVLGA